MLDYVETLAIVSYSNITTHHSIHTNETECTINNNTYELSVNAPIATTHKT